MTATVDAARIRAEVRELQKASAVLAAFNAPLSTTTSVTLT
jgi:hypothetical protein